MTAPAKPRRRRARRTVLIVVILLLALIALLIYLAMPEHRTAFLVDTSQSRTDIAAISSSVGMAARNVGDGDALSLRRFGGTCGAAGDTVELVGSGKGRGEEIAAIARTLTSSGKATLQSGVLAAIDGFSPWYPFRGLKRNRIVVVTSHGTDGCTGDQDATLKMIRERVVAAGLTLECRFVGFQVPEKQRDALRGLARACGAPEPQFVNSTDELDAVLHELVLPDLVAKPVDLPSDPPSLPVTKEPERHQFIVALLTGWDVTVKGIPGKRCAATGRADSAEKLCQFRLAEGESVTLTATISGRDPMRRAHVNPDSWPGKTPYWYGCDQGPRSRSCTVTLTRERLANARAKSSDSPSTSMAACVTTQDPAFGGLAAACEGMTGSPVAPSSSPGD